MAREVAHKEISPILSAADHWIRTCLIEDRSMFGNAQLWTTALIDETHQAFVEHPDEGDDDFVTKLTNQMKPSSSAAQQLMAEMLWALLLFPSNMKGTTKRHQIQQIWSLSGQKLNDNVKYLGDSVLNGIGSGGPGFNNYRPNELEFLIALVRSLKNKNQTERFQIFSDYDSFMPWMTSVQRQGSRQFRHMLRYFAFPDRVERISSNNDRRKILVAFERASVKEADEFDDEQLDGKLFELRTQLQSAHPGTILDFYDPPLKEKWNESRKIKTEEGDVSVTVPIDDDEEQTIEPLRAQPPDARQSMQIQAKLAKIGSVMGFKIWIPRNDRGRIKDLLQGEQSTLIDTLPLNYDLATIDTIEQIDVLWLKGRSIVRAFEVEHTTAVYSGLLRMADLLALQPNMNIRLHIVAPDDRREKVFREMMRPVFSLLERGPLSESCTFISYESIEAMNRLEHLTHTRDGIIAEYEEKPGPE